VIHLHAHSNFSFLDGASPPDRLLQRAAELEMPALALTDHNGLYGMVRFLHAARAQGIKPIVGAEMYIRLPEDDSAEKAHFVLLAKNREGYGNLCRIITRAQLDYQDDPQITLDDLAPHAGGLIALTACRRGEVAASLLRGDRAGAIAAARRYRELFGDDLWIEMQHHLLPDDDELVAALLDVAIATGIRPVITNNVHYAYPHEYRLRDIMACIGTRTTVDDWTPLRHANAEYYLKSEAEMREAFALPRPVFDACVAATHEIADACNLELLAVTCRPPDYPVPAGETAFSHLYALCQENVRALYRPLTPEVSNQLAHELSVIEQMGLASFFLCVWDIVQFARGRGIRCAGRGSAADSIVAYVLGITAVDPLANNLLFERFLNPGRVGMPDVDIDFDSRRRDEVIAYIQDKYGEEHAAMVANVITYRARSAFRDVAKAIGFAPAVVDTLAAKLSYHGVKNMREEFSLAGSIPAALPGPTEHAAKQDALLPVPSLTPIEQVIELCEALDGYPRHLSLHNGGMLITAEPLVDVVPLELATSGVRVCQFNKDDVEMLGLIKFDILGLRTLSILDEAVRTIKQVRGIDLPIDAIPLDDPACYDLACSSRTIGIFQIESPGQWALLARAQPRTFGDLIIQIALFRPGPLQGGMVNPYIERRLGNEPIVYSHPSLENCLRDTLGVVIFQEQVLQVAHDFAGLDYADADGLRRAMSHYRTEAEMNVCRDVFVESAVKLGRDRDLAERMYEAISYFSGYGFCRSHAAAFAKTVYQTLFLKVYYPAEFLAAILSNEPCCYYPPQTIVEEARRWGIRVLPVDINRSGARYTVEHGAIRMGIMQVKGLTEDSAEEVVAARGRRPFHSFADFWRRSGVDRDVAETLISVGAFDSLGTNRRALLWSLEETIRTTARVGEAQRRISLDTRIPVPELPPLSELDVAGLDYTLQGASARYSVMQFYRRSLREARVLSIGRLEGKPHGATVRTGGIVVSRQRPPTAKGMTFLVLADEEGELPVAIYPNVYEAHRLIVNGSSSLVIEGTIQRERFVTSLLARRLWRLPDIAALDANPSLAKPKQMSLLPA
jgi:error-prone DNA polymerase